MDIRNHKYTKVQNCIILKCKCNTKNNNCPPPLPNPFFRPCTICLSTHFSVREPVTNPPVSTTTTSTTVTSTALASTTTAEPVLDANLTRLGNDPINRPVLDGWDNVTFIIHLDSSFTNETFICGVEYYASRLLPVVFMVMRPQSGHLQYQLIEKYESTPTRKGPHTLVVRSL